MINENSTAYLTVTFKDKNGVLVTPTTVTWKAHDKLTGTVLQAVTSLVAASTIEITIPHTVNVLLDPAHPKEVRVVTIEAVYDDTQHINAQYEYAVQNLKYI